MKIKKCNKQKHYIKIVAEKGGKKKTKTTGPLLYKPLSVTTLKSDALLRHLLAINRKL